MADISSVQRLMFGVSCLDAGNGQMVRRIWDDRFAEKEAMLIEAAADEKPEQLIQSFTKMLKANGYASVGECMLTFFVDYTQELSDGLVTMIWSLKNYLETAFMCNCKAVMQFAYVGQLGMDDPVAQAKNINLALEHNAQTKAHDNYRLCLIGKSALREDNGSNWKAALVYIDVLRRSQNMMNLLPTVSAKGQHDVGFLRYSEFDEERYNQLVQEKDRLDHLLNNMNSTKVLTLVQNKRKELIAQADRQYCINGAEHPQHPDMIVPDVRTLNPWATNTRAAAARGKNPAYNKARQITKEAVEATGQHIREGISAYFAEQSAQIDQTLERLLEEGQVGVKLRLNPAQMNSVLNMPPHDCPSSAPKLQLNYSESGVHNEIGEYLNYIKNRTISDELEKYARALQDAFAAIPQHQHEEEKEKLETRLNQVAAQLAKLPDAEAFCQMISHKDPEEADFNTNGVPATSYKLLLCRARLQKEADAAYALGNVPVDSFNERTCGIVHYDGAPLKALKIVYVDCVEKALNQLLRRR